MFFRKKQKVDLDAKFKEIYHEVNKITADAGNELSLKESVEEETKRVEGLLDED